MSRIQHGSLGATLDPAGGSPGTGPMPVVDPRPETSRVRRLARLPRPRRPQNAPSERPVSRVSDGDANHARARQGRTLRLWESLVGTYISLTQPRFTTDPTLGQLMTCLLKAADHRPRAVWPGSGGGCRARRHVGWTRRRSWHPRRSPRNTRPGRATPRGRATSDLVSRRLDPRRSRRQPPNEICRLPGHSETLATGHRPCARTRFPKRQPERTNSRHPSPAAHAMSPPSKSARAHGRGAPGRPFHVTFV